MKAEAKTQTGLRIEANAETTGQFDTNATTAIQTTTNFDFGASTLAASGMRGRGFQSNWSYQCSSGFISGAFELI
jgi:hypothetical protein